RVALIVESQDGPAAANAAIRTTEQQLTDTFTVGSQQEVTLPVVGVVSLRGVLRTELQPRLTDEIARCVRDPVVHAHALVGLSVPISLIATLLTIPVTIYTLTRIF